MMCPIKLPTATGRIGSIINGANAGIPSSMGIIISPPRAVYVGPGVVPGLRKGKWWRTRHSAEVLSQGGTGCPVCLTSSAVGSSSWRGWGTNLHPYHFAGHNEFHASIPLAAGRRFV